MRDIRGKMKMKIFALLRFIVFVNKRRLIRLHASLVFRLQHSLDTILPPSMLMEHSSRRDAGRVHQDSRASAREGVRAGVYRTLNKLHLSKLAMIIYPTMRKT